MDRKHDCAAHGCAERVDHDKLMCLKHWRMVPADIRSLVWSTWRRVSRDPSAYREARDKAVEAVAEKDARMRQGGLDL